MITTASPRAWRVAALACASSLALLAAGAAAPAMAQATTAQARAYAIPAGPLAPALNRFANESGLALVYPAELANGKTSPGVSGSVSPETALGRLLAGTGLTFRFSDARTVVIEAVVTGGVDDERVLGPVRVEGATGAGLSGATVVNGTNGSRDTTATEGTQSYTSNALTVGSKIPTTIRDLPQSVSVLTAQLLEDQRIVDFTGALDRAPGVTLVRGDTSLENTFYSRGFAITSIQIDGGAPLITGIGANANSTGFFPQIDLSQYDHVELLRGAAGALNGYGNPSGTVNLVRKKPLQNYQAVLEAQVGSWSNYRTVLDVTGPLAFNGDLRGRLVTTYQDNEYFYDIASDNKTLIYGILEYDLTSRTLLTWGASFTRQDSVPWYRGLPRFQNGDDLALPRETCLCFAWNRWDFDTTELFASLEHQLTENWSIKGSVTNNRQSSRQKVGYNSQPVNPINLTGPVLAGQMRDYDSDQLAAEIIVSGKFTVLGQVQEITVGANRSIADGSGRVDYGTLVGNTASGPYIPYPGGPSGVPGINVFDFDPYDPLYTEPRGALPTTRYRDFGQEQTGVYLNLRLTALDRFHLVTALRYSSFELNGKFDTLCTSLAQTGCTGRQVGEPAGPPAVNPTVQEYDSEDVSWPPSVSLLYDINDQLTAYVGYTDVYISQGNQLDRNLDAVDPITGSNLEVGLKWLREDGRLNATIAAYKIEQNGFAVFDVSAQLVENGVTYYVDNDGNRYQNGLLPGGQLRCCFIGDPGRTFFSQGVDFELGGQIFPDLELSLSYTYNENEQRGSSFGTNPQTGAGTPFVSRQPEHTLKAWAAWSPRGQLDRFTFGGGVVAQSSAYNSGTACVRFSVNFLGVLSCDFAAGGFVPYRYTQSGRAIWSGRVEYDLDDRWSFAVNVNNLTDETYYQTTGAGTGNWYGEPRSFTLSLRAKW
ncbi:hypothetical protein BZG35_08365 [Brevundimonas sp. LM2]|uniref:TonB-dependent siderophore receptor n=1 Tax=Brevundimonas sp. LM2 TaxID=1938605 RepID=UPI000983EB8F|nr:TonB-dependent receptor [Brevundimonas sp. LM2]AQR61663.1 hypothetical protein BZG35_08365 [Brevundimonas sp. LM2]